MRPRWQHKHWCTAALIHGCCRRLCRGCWRSRDELRAWKASDDEFKRSVWRLVEQRQIAAGLQPD